MDNQPSGSIQRNGTDLWQFNQNSVNTR